MYTELEKELIDSLKKYYLRVLFQATILSNGVSINDLKVSDENVAKFVDGRLKDEQPGLYALFEERNAKAQELQLKVQQLGNSQSYTEVCSQIYSDVKRILDENGSSQVLQTAKTAIENGAYTFTSLNKQPPEYQVLLSEYLMKFRGEHEVEVPDSKGGTTLADNFNNNNPDQFIGLLQAKLTAFNNNFEGLLKYHRDENMGQLIEQLRNNYAVLDMSQLAAGMYPYDTLDKVANFLSISDRDIGLIIVPKKETVNIPDSESRTVALMKAEKLKREGKLALVVYGNDIDLPESVREKVKEIEIIGHWRQEVFGQTYTASPVSTASDHLQAKLAAGQYPNTELITLRACHSADYDIRRAGPVVPGTESSLESIPLSELPPPGFAREVGFEVVDPKRLSRGQVIPSTSDELGAQGKQAPYVMIIKGEPKPQCRIFAEDGRLINVELTRKYNSMVAHGESIESFAKKNQKSLDELRDIIYEHSPSMVINDRFGPKQKALIQKYTINKSSLSADEKALLKQFYAPSITLQIPHSARLPVALKEAARQGMVIRGTPDRDVQIKAYVQAVSPSGDARHLVPKYVDIKGPVSEIGPGRLKS